MRILFVTSEVAPFSKVGGLGDVAAALPRALTELGHEVAVVTPHYDTIGFQGTELEPVDPNRLTLRMGRARFETRFHRLNVRGVPVTLVDIPSLYHRGAVYTEDTDEHIRFAALSRAALELCLHQQWAPDVIHCNDWQTALIPVYLRTTHRHDSIFAATRTVLTIHNLAYQGAFAKAAVEEIGLGWDTGMLNQEHLSEGWVGFLESGITYADALTTVSPTYAREILTPQHGAGLDGLLRARRDDLVGILNGIDTDVWNPVTDDQIPFRYSEKSLWRKEWNKRRLLEGLGLNYDKGTAVFGVVSRLVHQKGIELLVGPLAGLLESTDSRFVALGTGEARIEEGLGWLVDRFPDRARFVSGYDEQLSHLIEAGSDVFLMPSLYEPCGLNQMYSLAYGTAPLVRRTGGLADTVQHWDPSAKTGTGFVFETFDEGGVWWALTEAVAARTDSTGWKQLQLNGMAVDNSWTERAGHYEDLYEGLVAR
ncbi:MAG: glycogen synthase [Acidimicrobiia bacterium]